ncbi:MAG: ABC transporter ATP-binding protein [Polyangiaceae bacterium]|nr:ABC transporter ATP-binding protein [Polyangiaceae bacterium]
MLSVDELRIRLGAGFALDGVSFAVAPGEIFAVLGPNGSGKSTLLRLLAGLAAPTGGSIAWCGAKLSAGRRVLVPPARRGVGLLLQEGVLFPHLGVRANVALGLGPAHSDDEAERRVSEALATARIAHLGAARIERLSGGEAQRVALARALVQSPRVMLLDEPFHSLDTEVKTAIMRDIRGLVTDRRLAAVLVTHDADEASALADRVMLLCGGRKIQEGTLDELYRAPADAWAARFLGEVESVDAATAAAAGIALPEHAGGTLSFRPDALLLEPSDGDGGLEVSAVRRCRQVTEVSVALPGGRVLVGRWSADRSPAVGERARARLAWLLPPSAEPEDA